MILLGQKIAKSSSKAFIWFPAVEEGTGYDVTVYDVSEEALKNIPARQEEWGTVLVERWGTDPALIETALRRTRLTADPAEAVEQADLMSESVFERLDLKRQTHTRFEGLCPADTMAFLKAYVERDHLGVKTGEGFYSYPDPAFSNPGFLMND
jgi:3-hydroxyacyl-CoA dehydrogenase